MENTIAVGARFTGTVVEQRSYGVIAKLGDTGATALVHVTRVAGDTSGSRQRRLNRLAPGATLEVEIVEVKQEGKQRKISASEKIVAEERMLSDLAAGTKFAGTIASVVEFGIFVRADEGLAEGYDGLVHVSELPGARVSDRENHLKAAKAGAKVTVEVLSVSRVDGDLRLSLTMRGDERRQVAGKFVEGTVHTGKVVKRVADGFVISFGAVTGFLSEDELGKTAATSLKVGGNTKVKVLSLDERQRLALTRRGL